MCVVIRTANMSRDADTATVSADALLDVPILGKKRNFHDFGPDCLIPLGFPYTSASQSTIGSSAHLHVFSIRFLSSSQQQNAEKWLFLLSSLCNKEAGFVNFLLVKWFWTFFFVKLLILIFFRYPQFFSNFQAGVSNGKKKMSASSSEQLENRNGKVDLTLYPPFIKQVSFCKWFKKK